MTYVMLAAHAAVVRTVQRPFNAVKLKAQTRTMPGFDTGAQMLQQRFHIAPVNVSAYRILKNGAQDALVFVTHNMLGLNHPDFPAGLACHIVAPASSGHKNGCPA